jgi:predicted Zn-dependent peptidase
MNIKRKTLRNGLNILMLHIPSVESVTFTVFVKVGSRYETAKDSGVSHFLEHMLFKGTQNYPTAADITTPIDAVGGDFNAFTSKENTQYYIQAERHHFDLAFDLLTDMALRPLMKEEEVEKEKGVVIEEINMYDDNPGAVADNALDSVMWPESALGWDVLGSKESVSKFSRGQIFKYKERYYQPSNIILGVSGNFDEKKVLEKISHNWGALKNIAVPKLKRVADKQNQPRFKCIDRKTQQAHIALGFKSFAHDNPSNYASYLLAILLGGNMSSRLFTTIREERGLAYSIGAGNTPHFYTGQFVIQAGLKTESAKEAIVQILSELRKIKSDLVSDTELQRAKDYFKGKVALMHENSHRRLDWALDAFASSGEIKKIEDTIKKVMAVTPLEVQKVANKIFVDAGMSLAVVGPYDSGTEFKKELHFKHNYVG